MIHLPGAPQALHVSGSSISRCAELDGIGMEDLRQIDPRGVLWMWEEPKSHGHYVMACDPSFGIPGWSRAAITDEDKRTDNSSIVILRLSAFSRPVLDHDGKPEIDPYTRQPKTIPVDLQVAEYAAPIDAVEAARVCNVLGRIYAGDEDDQCELIYESFPGPGVLTTQELLRLGYGNLWHWEYFADSIAEETQSIGWRSNQNTQRVLWHRARRHLIEDRLHVMSPWLVDEYSNAIIDADKMRAKAAYGFHDDRIQAASMALWAGHKWTYDPERTVQPVTTSPVIDWQHAAPVLGDNPNYRDAWADAIDNWD